jgi:hypothetical protein
MSDTSPALALLNPAPLPGGKKKSVLAMQKALDGDVQGPDILTSTAHMIENLTAEQAHALVSELTDTSDFNAFKLGGVLSRIYAEKWFDPHDNFKSYVEGVHGFGLSKATYLVGIYNALVDLGVPWKELKPIGWSKLKELSGIIDKTNAAKWLAIAADRDVTVMKLHDLVKAEKAGGQAQIGSDSAATSKVTLKLHDDQSEIWNAAIEKAKAVSGTPHDSVAAAYIAQDYLGNAEKVGAAAAAMEPAFSQHSIIGYFKSIGPEESLALIDLAFPEANISVEITWPETKQSGDA